MKKLEDTIYVGHCNKVRWATTFLIGAFMFGYGYLFMEGLDQSKLWMVGLSIFLGLIAYATILWRDDAMYKLGKVQQMEDLCNILQDKTEPVLENEIKECLVKARKGDTPLKSIKGHPLLIRLHKYAIIPLEEYYCLLRKEAQYDRTYGTRQGQDYYTEGGVGDNPSHPKGSPQGIDKVSPQEGNQS